MKTEWKRIALGEILDYEQPTKYIVESTDYKDEYETPVLTAGKSFLLGYTNETEGIYENPPVIIFDDFTTSSQYVDFKFKVKSSAMKLLTSKNDLINIKFVFLAMQRLRFDITRHKRYYLSAYQNLKISIPFKNGKPDREKQNQIVGIIEKAEDLKNKRKKSSELSDEYLKAVFNEMFLKSDFERVELGNGELFKIGGGKRLPLGERFSDKQTKRPYLRVTDMRNQTISQEDLRYITESIFEKIKNYTISSEDIYITIAGTIGLSGSVPKELDGASLTENAAKISILDKEKIDKLFLSNILSSDYVQNQINSRIGVVGVPKLALFRIATLKIPLPPIELQNRFASIVKEIEKLKEKQKQSKESIEELFDSLVKKAFAGELI